MNDALDDTHAFKNFHRALCERFDYCHDERDWRRDQVSLIEHIFKKQTPPTGEDERQAPAWPDMGEGWYVTVGRRGHDLLTITDTIYSGCADPEPDESLIVGAARHLLAFVGYGLPSSDFSPDDSVPHPPTEAVRQPLTEAQITAAMHEADWPPAILPPVIKSKLRQFARAIERVHGIKGVDDWISQ